MDRPEKMKNYSSFNEWKMDQSFNNQELITELSEIVADIAAILEKTVKWGQGCWVQGKDHKFFIHCKPDHIQFGFYNGAKLNDPESLLQGNGKFVRHIKIFSTAKINLITIKHFITQVI